MNPDQNNTNPFNSPPASPTPQMNPAPTTPPPTTNSVPQPEVSTLWGGQSVAEIPKKSGKLKFVAIFLVLLLVLFSGTAGAAYAVAYEKISIGNDELQSRISNIVINLPFMPKTPKFLLESAALAHEKVDKHSYDVSIAMESDDFASSLGVNKLDIQAKGGIDYSDEKNFKFSMNLAVTKDFNLDVRKKDQIVYLKVNKIPAMVSAFVGIEEAQLNSLFDNWIGFDVSTLDTEARKSLNFYATQEDDHTVFDQTTETFLQDKVLKAMQISDETEEGFATYKIHLDADKEIIDFIEDQYNQQINRSQGARLNTSKTRLSDMIKEMKFDYWIDKDSYLIRKFVVYSKFKPEYDFDPASLQVFLPESATNVLGATTLGKSEYTMVAAFKFGDFGKELEIETPEKYLKPEEFYQLMQEQFRSSSMYGSTIGKSYDAVRKSDLTNIRQALVLCYEETNQYPNSLNDINSCGAEFSFAVGRIPVDPETKKPYEYSTNATRTKFTLKTKLSTGEDYILTESN